MENKPIKRHPNMQPLSREHHTGLLFCWKIRTGIKQHVALSRITDYAEWFWGAHLLQHFETEEAFLFPILGNNNTLVAQALLEHNQLKQKFNDSNWDENLLASIADLLEQHIRFEERVLFNEIENVANESQMRVLSEHTHDFCETWPDEFWKEKH